jgi:transcriptional pleiotropic regulator of transition state genes
MKATGVTRPIDNLGRVVIPREILNANGWIMNEDRVEFFTDAGTVIIRKLKRGCTFCKSTHELKEFGGQEVCGHCRGDIRKLYREGGISDAKGNV